MPSTKEAATGRARNQRVTCWDGASMGSGQPGTRSWATAARAPSRWPHDGGMGRWRPPRSSKTGWRNMPSIDGPSPAVARCTTIGATPTTRPRATGATSSRRHRRHPRATRARPTPTTRSGRHSSDRPSTTPPATSQARARGRPASRASAPRRARAAPTTARATAPFQARAVSPIGVTTSSTPRRPQAVATRRPHGRARAKSPKMIPRCWTRPYTRSEASVVPATRNQAARPQRLPGP